MKLYKNAMAIGRFHGPHNGHVGLIQSMIGLAEKSLVFIGSSQEEDTERNPLHIATRIHLMQTIFFHEIKNKLVTFVPIPDMTDETDVCHAWGRYLLAETVRQTGRLPDLTVFGKEPSHNLWYSSEDDSNMATLSIPKTSFENISSTDVRWFIVNGDYRNFIRVTPVAIHNQFDNLREQLLDIPFYANLLKNRGVCSLEK